jgi:hypothetical protein
MSRFLFPLDIENVPERFVVLKENDKKGGLSDVLFQAGLKKALQPQFYALEE